VKLRRVWMVIAWALVLLVIYLSLTPHPPEPVRFDNADKFEHALAYAALSFWFCHLYKTKYARLLVIVALACLGVVLEYVQGWTGYRTFDVMDMLADSVGVVMGFMLTPAGRMLDYIENYLKAR
jgi:VanZ family protein